MSPSMTNGRALQNLQKPEVVNKDALDHQMPQYFIEFFISREFIEFWRSEAVV